MAQKPDVGDSAQARARAELLEEIAAEVAATAAYLGTESLDPRILEALRRVPRHVFVPEEQRPFAYENRPLPIGAGQTISQPYIVAIMTELARPGPQDRVLEIGTGCGYQAAVLGELAAEVDSIERVPELAAAAARRLDELGYVNIRVMTGDGTRGWPEGGPYDAILVTAAAQEKVPEALIAQLAPGGRLVIPVVRHPRRGGPAAFDMRLAWFGPEQDLMLFTKNRDGRLEQTKILPVAFVPLIPEDETSGGR